MGRQKKQAQTDSLAAVKEAERQAEEVIRLAIEARKKAVLDSTAQAVAAIAAAEQARADSVVAAKEAERVERLRMKEEEEKAAAEVIRVKKEEEEAAKQAEIVRVREQRKVNSIKETTVVEPSKTTVTTIADIYGVKTTYSRITHSWGETFYYKGTAIISEGLYRTEMENVRTEVNPENILIEGGQ